MKKQADRNRKEVKECKVGNKVLISTKDFFNGVDEESDEEVDGEVYRTIYDQEDCIRECSRVGVTGVVKNTPSS